MISRSPPHARRCLAPAKPDTGIIPTCKGTTSPFGREVAGLAWLVFDPARSRVRFTPGAVCGTGPSRLRVYLEGLVATDYRDAATSCPTLPHPRRAVLDRRPARLCGRGQLSLGLWSVVEYETAKTYVALAINIAMRVDLLRIR